jgi:hypothetical protein
MKFVLFVEGHTEKLAVPQLLKRWLDPRLAKPVGIKVSRFEGWLSGQLYRCCLPSRLGEGVLRASDRTRSLPPALCRARVGSLAPCRTESLAAIDSRGVAIDSAGEGQLQGASGQAARPALYEQIEQALQEDHRRSEFFQALDPAVAYAKCPNLKLLLDDMLQLAQEVGL